MKYYVYIIHIGWTDTTFNNIFELVVDEGNEEMIENEYPITFYFSNKSHIAFIHYYLAIRILTYNFVKKVDFSKKE